MPHREGTAGSEPELGGALVEQWPMAVALLDDAMHFRLVNEAFAEHVGASVERLLGRSVEDVLGTQVESLQTPVELVLRTGESILDVEIPVARADGRTSRTSASFSLVEAEGFRGVGVVVFDLGRRSAKAELRRRSAERARSLLMATGEILWTTDPSGSVVEDSPSWRRFTGQSWEEFRGRGWLDAVHPDDRAVTLQAWEGAIAEQEVFQAGYRLLTANGEYHPVLARGVPVSTDGDVQEWFGLVIDLSSVAHITSDDEGLSAKLELVSRRQASLRELAAYLSGALTTAEVVELAISRSPELLGAEGALIVLLSSDRGPRVVGQRDMPREAGANWLVVPDDADFPAAQAIRTGKRVEMPWSDDDGYLLDTFPFLVEGTVIGAITYSWSRPQRHDPEFATDVTDVIAEALTRAQHFEREQSIAVSLQRSMLPSTLPRVDGAELGVLYLPGSEEADVGGDWFESILLDDGRLLIAVGDVMGKGLPAASTMSEFRHALKALSVVSSSPRQLLKHLGAYHATRSGDKGQLLTLLLALVDPQTGALTWASAGHIPPVLVLSGGKEFELLDSAQGLPLGLGEDWCEGNRELPDDATLLLVSDGLVEDRHRSMDEGLEQLQSVLTSYPIVSAAQACDIVADHLVADTARADDVTVLCLRKDESITSAGWELEAALESVSMARRLVGAELRRVGVIDPQVVQTMELLTSELVTNAVRVSTEHVTVCLDRIDRLLRLTVVDTNPDIRLEPRPIEVEAEHGRGLQLVESLSNSWGVTPMGWGKQVWFELELDR
jgi:PAS domain S-box-containing protein